MKDIKSANYDEFVEKFKPKKTTDDCYTPDNVYCAIAEWVAKEYNLNQGSFVRPFYPGGDYENFDYNGYVVVDNPPFSILSKIIGFYIENHVKFFLFAPTFTLFSGPTEQCSCMPIGIPIEYENGAKIPTSFVTNLEPKDVRIRTVPELYKIIERVNNENIKTKHQQLPKYIYPPYVVTSAQTCQYSRAGIEIVIPRCESVRVKALDSQKQSKKKIFGDGYFVSERCKLMLEKAELELKKPKIWRLSDREYDVIKSLTHC